LAELIYLMLASLDGFVADESGNFDWTAPDEEVHAFVNDLERGVGTHLYGRRMYEVMTYWETADTEDSGVLADYARIWQSADKVVYSRMLKAPRSARTRIERAFDPDVVGALKDEATADLSIGGPELAAAAFAAGLVDQFHLFLAPVVVGEGKRALPRGQRLDLELVDERRFRSGMVHLHYGTKPPPDAELR
jgi:dihydrofolate reductase